MNHPAAHRDRMMQRFVSDSNLLERMNAARRNRQVDGASANDVPFTRIGSSFVKIHIVPSSSQIRREQSTRQTAADQNKSCHSVRIYDSEDQESRKSRQNECNPRSIRRRLQETLYNSLKASPK